MTISFSGLASGIDTSSWVESLVALKRAKVTNLQKEKEEITLSKDTLSSIKSFFASFRSTIQKITDSRFNIVSMDLFAQNIATSSNLDILTATATTEAEEGTYKIKVDKIATATKATSKYRTMVTETTTAKSSSLLKHLGVNAGTIGVTVDGVTYGVNITDSDTIATFIDKLRGIGVEASYNENSGVFSVNLGAGDIQDNGTNIIGGLHLDGINEGYQGRTLTIEATETVFTMATEDTLLKDLGVRTGNIKIAANGTTYTVAATSTTDIGDFITSLQSKNIDATFSNGIFTLEDATIVSEGGTNIINAMGLEKDVYSKSQATKTLTFESTTVETTVADVSTKIKDLGNGTAISNGDTVKVKNSNNETVTITLTQATTVGQFLSSLRNAGLYAEIENGIVEISGGTIVSATGSFDPTTAFGLQSEPYTATATGNPLTETITEYELVTLQTRLVEDLGVTRGYLEVTDSEGNKFYEKIYSGQTISDLMADFANLGIYSKLDEKEGVLEITGGAFRTLTDAEVNTLIGNHTIAETDANYKKGTNLLQCLYGADVIATEQIAVASTYSRTRALTHSVTTLTNATLETTLGTLGLGGNGTAIFDVRGDQRTINVTKTMTVQGLMDALEAKGIESSWDEDFSRITINNATINGGTSNLADVLDLSTTISGKYVTSNELYSNKTITVTATDVTTLKELGVTGTQAVVLNCENGDKHTFNVTGDTTIEGLITSINNSCTSVTASIDDNGVFHIDGGYITNAAIEEALGLETTVSEYSNVLGTKITHTIITTATGDTTLGQLVTALNTTTSVAAGYNLKFNDVALNVNANTTIDDLMMQIHAKGGSTSIDSSGRLHVEGGTLTGSVATALGFSSVSTTNSVAATGQIHTTINTIFADSTTKLGDINLGASTITVYGTNQTILGTITTEADTTVGEIFSALASYGITGTIKDGVIHLESDNGNYALGGVLNNFGITTYAPTQTTVTVGTTNTSSTTIKKEFTIVADSDTRLGDLVASPSNVVVKGINGEVVGTIETNADMTVGDLLTALAGYGISGTIDENGIVYLASDVGNYATGALIQNTFGIALQESSTTVTVGTTVAGTATEIAVSVLATGTTKLVDLGCANGSKIEVVASDGTVLNTITVTNTMTINGLLSAFADNGIQARLEDGVIKFNDNNTRYVRDLSGHNALNHLEIGTEESTIVKDIFKASSTGTVQKETVDKITSSTKLGDIEVLSDVTWASQNTISITDTNGNALGSFALSSDDTVEDMFTKLAVYGITGMVTANGEIVISSESGNVVSGTIVNKLGFALVDSYTVNVGKENKSETIKAVTTVIADENTKFEQLNVTAEGDIATTVKDQNGTVVGTFNLEKDSSIGELFDELSKLGIRGEIQDGVVTLESDNNYYAEGDLITALGVDKVTHSESFIVNTTSSTDSLTAKIKVAADESTTFGQIGVAGTSYYGISTGTTELYYGSVTSDMTIGEWFDVLEDYGIKASIVDGVISFDSQNGNYISGTLVDVLGCDMTDVTVQKVVQIFESDTITANSYMTGETTLGELGLGIASWSAPNSLITVTDTNGNVVETFNMSQDNTVDDLLAKLLENGITGVVNDGKITLYSEEGRVASGDIITALGFANVGSTVITTTMANTLTSTATLTATTSVVADENTTLSQLGLAADGEVNVLNSSGGTVTTIATTTNMSLGTLLDELASAGVDATLKDGVITFDEDNTNYVVDKTGNTFLKNKLGIGTVQVEKTVVLDTVTSTQAVTFAETFAIDENTTFGEIAEAQSTTLVAGTKITVKENSSTVAEYTIDDNTTIETILDKFATLGIESTIDENGVITLKTTNKEYTYEGAGATLLDLDGIRTETIISGSTFTSTNTVTYNVTTTQIQSTTLTLTTESTGYITTLQFATEDTTFAELGITDPEDLVFERVRYYHPTNTYSTMTITMTSTDTISDFIDRAKYQDFRGSIENGVITFTENYTDGQTIHIQGGLVEALGIETVGETASVGTKTLKLGETVVGTEQRLSSSTYVDTNGAIVGTDDIVEIRSAEALKGMIGKTYSNKTFILTGDIAVSGVVAKGITLENCTFDGQEYHLDINLTIKDTGTNTDGNYALFSSVEGSTFKNISISTNIDVSTSTNTLAATSTIGGLVASATNSTFEKIRIGNDISITDISTSVNFTAGGLVGNSDGCIFDRIAASGAVAVGGGYYGHHNNNTIAGFVGYDTSSSFTNISLSNETIVAGQTYAGVTLNQGELIGTAQGSSISNIAVLSTGTSGKSFIARTSVGQIGGSAYTLKVDTTSIYTTAYLTKVNGQSQALSESTTNCLSGNESFDSGNVPILKVFDDNYDSIHVGLYDNKGQYLGQVTVTADTTNQDFSDLIDSYGIKDVGSGLNYLRIDGYVDSKAIREEYSDEMQKSSSLYNIIYLTPHTEPIYGTVYSNTTSDALIVNKTIEVTTTAGAKATLDTTFAELGITENLEFKMKEGEASVTVTVITTETLGNMVDFLNNVDDIDARLEDGILTITNNTSSLIFEDSALLNALGIDGGIAPGETKTSKVLYTSPPLEIETITTVTVPATLTLGWDTTFGELGLTDDFLQDAATIILDGQPYALNAEASDTVGEFLTEISSYGFTVGLNDGKVTIGGGEGKHCFLNTAVENALGFESSASLSSATFEFTSTTDELSKKSTNTISTDDTLSDFGIADIQTIDILSDGIEYQITLRADDTVGDMFTQFASHGINAAINNGTLVIQTTGDSNITDISNGLKNALHLGDITSETNTQSHIINESSNDLKYSTTAAATTQSTLAELGMAADAGGITVRCNGLIYNISVEKNDTLDDLFTTLAGVGIKGELTNGKVTLTGDSNAWIGGMNNMTFLKLDNDANADTAISYYTTSTHAIEQAFVSAEKVYINTISVDDTLGTFGVTDSTISIKNLDGSTSTINLGGADTVGYMLTQLASYDINASIEDGKIKINAVGDNYITGIYGNLGTQLGLTVSGGVVDDTIRVNTSTGQKTYETDVAISTDTRLDAIGVTASNPTITINSDGTKQVINLSKTNTVDDMFSQLAAYGIEGSIQSGKIVLQTTGNAFIAGTTGLEALKLGTAVASTITSTTTINPVSSQKGYTTQTVATTGNTLEEAGMTAASGNITVVSNGTARTVTVEKGDTIDDVISSLAGLGISGSLNNGTLTLTGDSEAYISYMDSNVADALKINNAANKFYTQDVVENAYKTGSLDAEAYNNTISTDDTLRELGMTLSATPTNHIKINYNGAEYTITVRQDDTVGDMLTQLASYDLNGYINGGKLYVRGNGNSYITDVGTDLNNVLKLGNFTNETVTEEVIKNDDSKILYSGEENRKLQTTDTFKDIGITSTKNIKVVSDGVEYIIKVESTDTIDDMLTALAGVGIHGALDNGVLTLYGDNDAYISNMDDTLAAKLHITGAEASYSSEVVSTTSIHQASTTVQDYNTVNTLSTDDTLATFGVTNNQKIEVVSNGDKYTITLQSSDTVDDMLTRLASYGIEGFVKDGKLTLKGNENAYILSVSSNLAEKLDIDGQTYYDTSTVNKTYANKDSNVVKQTITATATGTTQLQDLRNPSGNATSNYKLVLTTKSDAGNETNVTLTYNATDSLYTVMDELARHGLEASIDSAGRFSVKSSTLTDFDIAGGLGTFLMGSYTKVYDEGNVYSVSTNLVQQTVVNMDDDTKLSKIGITNGNIILHKDGTNYTIAIDNTKTVGDFRNKLAEYGVHSEVIDGKLQLLADGVVYTTTPASGASNLVTKLGIQHANWDLGGYSQESKELVDPETIVVEATLEHTLSQLTDASGSSLGIKSGMIYAYQDGTRNSVYIDENDTIQDVASKLSQYGITVGIDSNGKVYFDGDNNSYLTTDGIASASASNVLTKLNVSNNWSTRYNSTSETLDYDVESDPKVDGSTKLVDLQDASGNSLGISTGNYYVYQNGVRTTESITDDTTVDDFRATLATYGISTDFDENGSLAVGAYNETYLATAATAEANTNAIDILFEEWNFTNIYTSNDLEIPTDVTVAISETTKLADINETPDIFNETIAATGTISVIKDGVKTDIELNNLDTVGDFIDELALYGFETVINGNGQLIVKNTGDSRLEAVNGSKGAQILELFGLKNWISTNSYEGSALAVTTTTTDDYAATRETKLSELGVTTGEYYIWNDGVKTTAYISSDETLGSFIDTLKSFGLETSLVNVAGGSKLSIEGSGNCYIQKSASVSNSSNIVERLFETTVGENYRYTGYQETSTTITTTPTATEDIKLSKYDTGSLTAAGKLDVVVDGVENSIEITSEDTIGTLLNKFNALGLEATYNDGVILIQDGYKTFSIKNTGTSDLVQTIGLVHKDDLGGYSASSVVTEQTTQSTVDISVANYASATTKMGLLNITDGSLTIYRDGQKATVSVLANETFGQLQGRIQDSFGDVVIDFNNGYLTIRSTNPGVNVDVGSTTDSSNFSAITGITSDGAGKVESARELYCVNETSLLTTADLFRNGDITEGTFVVGDATFTIEATTSLSSLISQINSSETSQAIAFWDTVDGKFVITSRKTGAALVNIEAGTSNFTDIMGLTESTWKPSGEVNVTKMVVDAQEVGENARFSINGTYYTSTSNNITSDVSRIKGVTINLKGITEGEETVLKIERDKETVANAVSDIVDAYNELIENIDKEIAKEAPLNDQFTLKLIRNQIRTIMTSSITGTNVYKNLSAVGISLDEATAGNINTDRIDVLNFDRDKFIEKFDQDRFAVRNLLVGTETYDGIFLQVEKIVGQSLDGGYFTSAERSFNNQISRIDQKIKRANEEVERYRERLEAKFASMDLLISKMQNQFSSFLGT